MKNAGSGVGNETKAAVAAAQTEGRGMKLKPSSEGGNLGMKHMGGAAAELHRQHPHNQGTDYGALQNKGKEDHERHEPLHGMSPRERK